VYSWIGVNFVLGRFDHSIQENPTSLSTEKPEPPRKKTVGALDMGGASAQIAFEVSKPTYVPHDLLADVNLGCDSHETIHNYRVYVATFLSFGSNAARQRYVGHVLKNKTLVYEKIGGHYHADKMNRAAKNFCSTRWSVLRRRHTQGLYPLASNHRLNESLYRKIYKDVAECSPSQSSVLDVSRYRIVLLGQTGSGKTSFFNSLNSTMRGYVTHQAATGQCDERPTTTMSQEYEVLSPLTGRSMGWCIGDTVGLQAQGGIGLSDIQSMIDGSTHYQWQSCSPHINPRRYTDDPFIHQTAHCCALVIDAPRVNSMTAEMWNKLDILQRVISARGIPVVILLTKIDRVTNGIHGNHDDVFYSQPIRDIVRKINSRMRNVPLNRIFPVKNYDSEFFIDVDMSILILLAFREILHLCERYLQDKNCVVHRPRTWKDKFNINLLKSTKLWVSLIVIFILFLCVYFEFVKHTLVWRENVAMALVTIMGRCFIFGWTQDCYALFGDLHTDYDDEYY
ncbi:hypothetical protein QZH41_019512, partial [Actinostola sp. cb2023]